MLSFLILTNFQFDQLSFWQSVVKRLVLLCSMTAWLHAWLCSEICWVFFSPVGEVFMLRDSTLIPHVLWFEYTSSRSEARYYIYHNRRNKGLFFSLHGFTFFALGEGCVCLRQWLETVVTFGEGCVCSGRKLVTLGERCVCPGQW